MALRLRSRFSSVLWLCAATAIVWICGAVQAQEQKAIFVPPPRSVADITAILDREKPDPNKVAKLRAGADAKPSGGGGRAALAKFHYERCIARSTLGEIPAAITDCQRAVELGQGAVDVIDLGRLRQGLAVQYSAAGDPRKALEVSLQTVREIGSQRRGRGWLFNTYKRISDIYLQLGDFSQAENYVTRTQALIQEARGWPTYGGYRRPTWERQVETARAGLYEARGQFREAEAAYRRAEVWMHENIRKLHTYDFMPPPPDQLEQTTDLLIAAQGRMKARQGRFAEGEADVRRALLSRLKATGKYNVVTVRYIGHLANLLVEEGRFAEAEALTRTQLDVLRALGVATDADNIAGALNQLAAILNLEGRWEDAAKVYAELDEATKSWAPARRETLSLNINQIATLYNTNNLESGLAAAERLLARNKSVFGDKHVDTALAHGMLAIGLAKAQRESEALGEFRLAIPVLVSAARETDSEDASEAAAREQRAQIVIEAYIALLARSSTPQKTAAAAEESFPLADVLRGSSVQRALAAASARAAAKNPALAELARRAQDLDKQVAAQLGVLNNALALPTDQRDDKAVKALLADIDKLRASRDSAKRELAGKFRDYSSLIEPQAPTIADIRAMLKPDEAFLSFYFGREASFAWAVRKEGLPSFAALPLTTGQLEEQVKHLREALDPEIGTIEEIPPFDLEAAHWLYRALLQPVEAGWRPAKSLIVATNGAVGLLPLSILPTTPSPREKDSKFLFDAYRHVPWLARTHAVSQVPSAAALRTLRQLPPASTKRETFIGFGDPYFSAEQARAAQSAVLRVAETNRGISLQRRVLPQTRSLDSAELARLPRLPDTAEELKSVALALEADPAKVLKLGKDANERVVKTTDLSRFRIVAFATHGLIPGDLNGLTQPALALTAPNVADVDGDGLLTMEEVLALKLNADWVVLSACNTGAGVGAGAEAASGLGRAFFYAGSRALLVTNWSVHSASAREIVADLFRRQATDPTLSRAEALRQASMGLLDGPGYAEAGADALFTYGHPLFWAPYTLIGEGGAAIQ